jgi:PilZ domain
MGIDILKEKQRLKSSPTRRSPRLRLQVPVFIRGTDASGAEFVELTKTVNISANGACIACVHVLRPEQIIHLTIPAPSSGSSCLVPSETPRITAKVLRHSSMGEMRLLGLDFIRPLE